MAKRFTDTDKWKRPWFRGLNLKARWAWIYICDTCDHAGLWIADFETMSVHVGFKVSESDLESWFPDKIIRIDADKYFVPSFIEFQYGELREDSRPHQAVIKALVKNGIDPKNLTLSKGYPKSIHTLKEQEKDKDQDKDQEQEKGGVSQKVSRSEIEAAYRDEYPLKKGKEKGVDKALVSIKSKTDLALLILAIRRYSADLKAKGTDPKYIMHFSTFMGSWRDWLDEDVGTSTIVASANSSPLDTWVPPEKRGA